MGEAPRCRATAQRVGAAACCLTFGLGLAGFAAVTPSLAQSSGAAQEQAGSPARPNAGAAERSTPSAPSTDDQQRREGGALRDQGPPQAGACPAYGQDDLELIV